MTRRFTMPFVRLPLWSILSVLGLSGCGNPPYPHGTVETLFADAQPPVISTVQVQGRTLNTVRVDSTSTAPGKGPMLLFVHGSPGDWKAWANYLKAPELATYSTRIAVDRPGFGGSAAGGVMPSLRAQAALLAQLIPAGQKAIVIGHSLGGPLVAWMAIDAPDRVCGAVSVAGSLSSKYEEPRWYNKVVDSGLVGWAIAPEMVQSNVEMMSLSNELTTLEQQLGALRVPLIVMQGAKDSLVVPASADEVEQRAPKAWLTVQRLPQENHFVLWEKPELVIAAIRSLRCD